MHHNNPHNNKKLDVLYLLFLVVCILFAADLLLSIFKKIRVQHEDQPGEAGFTIVTAVPQKNKFYPRKKNRHAHRQSR